MEKKKKKYMIILMALSLGVLLIFILSICFGATAASVREAWKAILMKDKINASYRIFIFVRLPRTLAALLAGMALSVSGVCIQGVLQNALAGPNIIGVNAGAGIMGLLVITLFPGQRALLPPAAFLGALGACLLIYGIAVKTGAGKITIVLAGVAVNSILSAGIDTIKTLYPDRSIDAMTFFVGGFSGINLNSLTPACYYIGIGLLSAFILAKILDILGLGTDTARGLGVNVSWMRFILLSIASVLAGAAVSFAGLLGFVGLIIPHIARRMVGTCHRILLPVSALLGAAFVMSCDLLSRILFAPYEIPVGIIMSFLGAPFFLWLLLKQKKEETYE